MSASHFTLRIGDAGYPAHLRDTPRPPRVLNGIGDPSCLIAGLAVIGSRKASPYGLECARRFAGLAASWGVVIVSGAAMGCDLAAHRAALDHGAPTVAVLGCGADVDYPRSAAGVLAEARAKGAVVSELAWGSPPLRQQFPARNRIIAGLSAAVLVVEAALPSGTFSTADHALEAGRDVFAVPGSIFYPGSAGCNRLIRQGAQPITCDDDLHDALTAVGLIDGSAAPCGPAPFASRPQEPVHIAISANPMNPDGICEATGLGIVEVMTRLSALEHAGVAQRYPDGRYGPCAAR